MARLVTTFDAACAPDDTRRRKAAGERALALAMASHPRLGAASPLARLTPELVSRIALLDLLGSTKFLVAVTVRTGLLVDCIATHYSDGSSLASGGLGGHERPVFRLSHGEHITKLRGRQGDHLDAVQFVTSFGRASAMYGGSGGQPFEIDAPEGAEFFAFAGYHLEVMRGPVPIQSPWLTRVEPVARRAPRAEWAEDIEMLRLFGFAQQESFISRRSPRPPARGPGESLLRRPSRSF